MAEPLARSDTPTLALLDAVRHTFLRPQGV